MKKSFYIVAVCALLYATKGQATVLGSTSLGAGIGLNYGGFGLCFSYLPLKPLTLFGGVGNNLNGLGAQMGAHISLLNRNHADCFFSGMYGYNAVLLVTGAVERTTTYYGPSVGLGTDFALGKLKRSFIRFQLIKPFRPEVYYDAIDALKKVGYQLKPATPVTFSLGFHVYLGQQE